MVHYRVATYYFTMRPDAMMTVTLCHLRPELCTKAAYIPLGKRQHVPVHHVA